MKTIINQALFLPVLSAALVPILIGQASAQTFTLLHDFTGGSDGAWPHGPLALSGSTLYGGASRGGNGVSGTVFALQTDGSDFKVLYSFPMSPDNTNSEGLQPYSGLILSGNTLYGITRNGGIWGQGTLFAVSTNGSNFTVLYALTINSERLTLSGTNFFAMPFLGGPSESGSILELNTDGTGVRILHEFADAYNPDGTNSGGLGPDCHLVCSGDVLYGTAQFGGASGNGTLFRISTDGTGFKVLHDFGGPPVHESPCPINEGGARPVGDLVLLGNVLYGATFWGGSSGNGTVFKINTDGTGFAILHNFAGPCCNVLGMCTISNDEGAWPSGALVLSGGALYGTTRNGGTWGYGTVFALNIDGGGFANLHSFSGGDGRAAGSLLVSDDMLYGTASQGGGSGSGSIFSISLPMTPPLLTIGLAQDSVVLTWPTNRAGFTLQSTTNLASPTLWNAVSPPPVVVNGRNTVTNPISSTQQFFRLSQ